MYGYGNSMFLATHGILARTNAAVLPVNTVAPAITGTAQEGQTLTCSTGTWTGTPTITYAYQWKRNNVNIGSATNSTYLLVSADVGQSIKCTVTATNGAGSVNADSNTVVPIAAFSFLLDTYSGAAAAYSLRKLRSAYTGNAIRVRRSSDNTEQDFGFVNNVLDTSSLLTFCGAGNGFVTTWYDQSGNARNATNTTAINQPKIVNAGAVQLKNGLPNLNFTTQFLLIGTQVNLTGNHYLTFVGNSSANATSPAGFITYQANDDPEVRIGAGTDGNGVLSYYNGGYRVNATTQGTTYSIFTHQMTGSFTSTFFRNSTQIATGSAAGALSNVQFFTIGAYSNSTNTRNGDCQEFIVWASDQSTNRTGITNNINGFYTIY